MGLSPELPFIPFIEQELLRRSRLKFGEAARRHARENIVSDFLPQHLKWHSAITRKRFSDLSTEEAGAIGEEIAVELPGLADILCPLGYFHAALAALVRLSRLDEMCFK